VATKTPLVVFENAAAGKSQTVIQTPIVNLENNVSGPPAFLVNPRPITSRERGTGVPVAGGAKEKSPLASTRSPMSQDIPRGLRKNSSKNLERRKAHRQRHWRHLITNLARKYRFLLTFSLFGAIVILTLSPVWISGRSILQSETSCQEKRGGIAADLTAASHVLPAHALGIASMSISFLSFTTWLFHSPHLCCTNVSGRLLDQQLGTFLMVQLLINACHIGFAFQNCTSDKTDHRVSIALANLVLFGSILVPNFLLHSYCVTKAQVMSSDV
jgi:hypothetical protein